MAIVKPRGGTGKSKNAINKSNSSNNPDRPAGAGAGGNNRRSKQTINRLKMYRTAGPKRNRKGVIVQEAEFQGKLPSGTQVRIEGNRRWFGNTRTITQSNLQKFTEEVGKVVESPYQVLLKPSKIPLSLLQSKAKYARNHILDTQSFEHTFGSKSRRKKPELNNYSNMEELMQHVDKSHSEYDPEKDLDLVRETDGTLDPAMANYLNAGTSRRIWNELYKVIDCSDVIIQVLDARDPMGTRCRKVENYLKKDKPHKHLMFVLNKVDLVPLGVTKKWVALLSKERPTIPFHASIKNSFGRGALTNLLRQFSKLHMDKKNISCGFIGYPNVGKSSVINTLQKKACCKAAPLAGETKVWQYITLMKRIFLIDCPGIVQPNGDTETDIILKGVVRVENVPQPDNHIAEILRRVKREYLVRQYRITSWTDHEDFLTQHALISGKLLKRGVPDITTSAKMMLNDWQRGRIPYFVRPPNWDADEVTAELEKTTSSTEAPSCSSAACCSSSGAASVEDPSTIEGPAATTTTVVEETGESNETQMPSALELEKKLVVDLEDYKGLKCGFNFTEDGTVLDEPINEDSDCEIELEEEVEGENVQVGESEEEEELPMDDEELMMVKEEKRLEDKKEIEEIDRKSKIKKRKRMMAKMKKANRSVPDLAFVEALQEKRAKEQEASRQRLLNKKRPAPPVAGDDEDDGLTSKQKRRKEREVAAKKTGNYYKSANIKNRNRNKLTKPDQYKKKRSK